jgi:hypothetical protein
VDGAAPILVDPYGRHSIRLAQLGDLGQVTEDGDAIRVCALQTMCESKALSPLPSVVLHAED